MVLRPARAATIPVDLVLRTALVVLIVATLVAVQRSSAPPLPTHGSARPAPAPPAPAASVDATLAAPAAVGASLVATLTGPDSANDTLARWNVAGTDLGHTFEHDGDLYMVFGDTWGADGAEGDDWRSNTMARIADWGDDSDPSDGLAFTEMIAGPDGRAAELLASAKVAGREKTVIPTYGIAVDGRMYLHYMSVREWGEPGEWTVNHSGLATSDDSGQSWTSHPEAQWPGSSNFAQVSLVQHDEHIYVFGIPQGRFGGAALARVAPGHLLDLDRYEYFDGEDWRQGQPEAAEVIIEAPVGELSVRWSPHHQRWLMLYLDEERAAIVLRTATELTGDWTQPRVVVTAEQFPDLYAPYLLPMTDSGDTVYFTMSVFGPYQVLLMATTLELPVLEAQGERTAEGDPVDTSTLVSDGGDEPADTDR